MDTVVDIAIVAMMLSAAAAFIALTVAIVKGMRK